MISKMIPNFQTSRHYPAPISPSQSSSINCISYTHLPNPNSVTPFPPRNQTRFFSSAGFIAARRISALIRRRPIFLDQFELIPRSKVKALALGRDDIADHTHILAKENGEGDVEAAEKKNKNFWAAVSLIIGTAVGPGMLGLPAATIKSGPLPSTIAILVSWVYVISSILLVAELSFVAMEEDGVAEVSFTGLATKAFGSQFGVLVSVIYASLSFSLMVACVSGIGSLVSQWLPSLNLVLAHSLFPLAFGCVICFFPFAAIDSANRLLCFLMLCSISTLVGIGLSVARANVLASFGNASWRLSCILPAIPVTVLTLGFHVVTPFICKVVGSSLRDACKAILIGGSVPLLMVLSWNLIVLGLTGTAGRGPSLAGDPISLLLSVKSSALFAVQGFAFSALATSFIGYALSLPKQLIDTLQLIMTNVGANNSAQSSSMESEGGRVGVGTYCGESGLGSVGMVVFRGSESGSRLRTEAGSSRGGLDDAGVFVLPALVIVPVLVASFFQSAFSRALDFAGVYANCFLFGILPPLMTYIYKARKKPRSSILPGGDAVLFLLFSIAVVLGIWH